MYQLIAHSLNVCRLSLSMPRLGMVLTTFGLQLKDDSTKWTLIYSNVTEADIRECPQGHALPFFACAPWLTLSSSPLALDSPPKGVGRARQVAPRPTQGCLRA
jgi:hypothetical protein